MRTLIKNIDILTMDEKLGHIQGGCILIEDDEIAFAGSEADLGKADDYDIIEDGRGMLAIPGLVKHSIPIRPCPSLEDMPTISPL